MKFAQEPVTGISEVQEPSRGLCLLGGEERNVQTLLPRRAGGAALPLALGPHRSPWSRSDPDRHVTVSHDLHVLRCLPLLCLSGLQLE